MEDVIGDVVIHIMYSMIMHWCFKPSIPILKNDADSVTLGSSDITHLSYIIAVAFSQQLHMTDLKLDLLSNYFFNVFSEIGNTPLIERL